MPTFKTSPLVSCELLRPQLGSSNLKIFDVRGGWGSDSETAKAAYRQGHVSGASFIDWRHDFVQDDTPINLASVATRDQAKAAFSRLNISYSDTVVLYDDYHHMQAGRIWWAMKYWGFSNVKILNGGWKRWVELGLETTTDIPEISSGNFQPELKSDYRVSLQSLVSNLNDVNLIDARGPVGYAGDLSDPRTGHIPSAVNIPYSLMLDSETGLFKPEAELRRVFLESYSNIFDGDIVSSCGSGYAGTVLILALAQIGIHAPLFDGSFTVWKQDTQRVVEQTK
ncbi:3-mercaptopyruvate sulfurtransferase [Arenicella sp. 4NH20-0111]|uniref:sulfurtransferase n=1 Tax=Arenicella sp. 4NH20-0111 TaxID=3127648 RepID=UPI0031070338